MASLPSHWQRAQPRTARYTRYPFSLSAGTGAGRGDVGGISDMVPLVEIGIIRRHPNSPTSPACGLPVYRKDTLRGNRVLRIYFGCLPWQGHWRKSSSLSKQRREMLILNKPLQMEKAGSYPMRFSLKTNGLDPNTTKPFQNALSPSGPRT